MTFSKTSAWLSVFFVVSALGAQTPDESILRSYERIFIRSGMSSRAAVLQDAATDDQAAEFYGPLCGFALDFAVNNAALFRDDPDMIQIIVVALRGLRANPYGQAAESLWQVFLRFPDNVIRFEALKTLPELGPAEIIEKVNQFLAEQNGFYGSGISPDPQLLSALFSALGACGDERSYPVLFSSCLIYPGDPGAEAVRALYALGSGLPAFLRGVILNNPPAEKLEAFKLALAHEGITAEEKGLLAETTLEAVLAFPAAGAELAELRRASVALIEETRWVRSLPQVLKYYNQTLAAFREAPGRSGGASAPSRKDELLDVIRCLSVLESAEAAQALGLQLGIYNSRALSLGPDENEVVLALVRALGNLGYKASYDVLQHISALIYPEEIKEAALNALESLKW
jgi:hypothetical protein